MPNAPIARARLQAPPAATASQFMLPLAFHFVIAHIPAAETAATGLSPSACRLQRHHAISTRIFARDFVITHLSRVQVVRTMLWKAEWRFKTKPGGHSRLVKPPSDQPPQRVVENPLMAFASIIIDAPGIGAPRFLPQFAGGRSRPVANAHFLSTARSQGREISAMRPRRDREHCLCRTTIFSLAQTGTLGRPSTMPASFAPRNCERRSFQLPPLAGPPSRFGGRHPRSGYPVLTHHRVSIVERAALRIANISCSIVVNTVAQCYKPAQLPQTRRPGSFSGPSVERSLEQGLFKSAARMLREVRRERSWTQSSCASPGEPVEYSTWQRPCRFPRQQASPTAVG